MLCYVCLCRTCWDGSIVTRDPLNSCVHTPCPACTSESVVCWDGSVVFRLPLQNCELDDCPPCIADIFICESDGSVVVRCVLGLCVHVCVYVVLLFFCFGL